MKKKAIALIMAATMLIGTSVTSFAAEGTEIPDGASVAGVGFTGADLSGMSDEEQEDYLMNSLNVMTRGTVYGNAGSSWVYLTRVDSLKSQASYGINCDYSMAALAWGLAYSDGKSASGLAAPFSKSWSGEKVQSHSSSGTKTVTFTATATTLDGKVLTSLVPTAAAYIY